MVYGARLGHHTFANFAHVLFESATTVLDRYGLDQGCQSVFFDFDVGDINVSIWGPIAVNQGAWKALMATGLIWVIDGRVFAMGGLPLHYARSGRRLKVD